MTVKYDDCGVDMVANIKSVAFYEKAKDAYAIIATCESVLYDNVILSKGIFK